MKIFKQAKYYMNFIPTNNKLHLLMLFTGLIVITALEMVSLGAIPGFVAVIIDADNLISFLPSKKAVAYLNTLDKDKLIIIFSIIILAFFIIKNIFIYLFIYFENIIYFKLGVVFSEKIFLRYQNLDYADYLDTNSPTLIRNCTDIVGNHVAFIKSCLDAIKDIFLILVISGLIIYFSSKESFYVLLSLSIITVLYYVLIKKKISKYATIIEDNRLNQIKDIETFFEAFKDIKLFNLDNIIKEQFIKKTLNKLSHEAKAITINATPRLVIEVLGIVFIFSLIFLALASSTDVKIIFPSLALYVASIVRLIPVFSSLTRNMSTFSYFKISSDIYLKEVSNLLKIELKKNKTDKFEFNYKEKAILNIKNVSFRYPSNKKYILKDINLTIDKNDFIGIHGNSGVGKTTLIDLLTGFLTPTEGKIIAFDKDINDDVQKWQNSISYVSQTSYLIDRNIAENISFNFKNEKINREKINKIIDHSELKKFIASLPEGLETNIGNDGVKISGGQRQRILIARGLFKDSTIIIIDEGTNALDLKTEQKILENLANNKDIIKIIVSHRKESMSKCNRVFKLDENGFNEVK